MNVIRQINNSNHFQAFAETKKRKKGIEVLQTFAECLQKFNLRFDQKISLSAYLDRKCFQFIV